MSQVHRNRQVTESRWRQSAVRNWTSGMRRHGRPPAHCSALFCFVILSPLWFFPYRPFQNAVASTSYPVSTGEAWLLESCYFYFELVRRGM